MNRGWLNQLKIQTILLKCIEFWLASDFKLKERNLTLVVPEKMVLEKDPKIDSDYIKPTRPEKDKHCDVDGRHV